MKIKEFAPQAYLSKVLQKTAPQASSGAPLPQNVLPKGPIKSNATVKTAMNKMNTATNKNLLKLGQKLPMPTAPGKEQDMEIVSVGMNDVKLKSMNAKQPGEFTVNKKDLDPVISNLLNRSRSQIK
jgi:lysophospholipase L1-like esterase